VQKITDVMIGHPAPFYEGESELVIMIGVADRRDGWVGPSSWPETITMRAQVGNARTIHESEMALFFEPREWCAYILLDTAGIVIALGKVWKRRNRR
jgi:hypothetical protein